MVNAILGMDYDLTRRLNELERIVRDLSTQPILLNASTGQGAGVPGLSTDKDGLHLFNPAGVEDITLATADGSANFNGNVTINGNLAVPNGSISNAALVAPVVISTSGVSQNNFAVSTSPTVYATANVTVPAGYSQADILCMVVGGAFNGTASADYLYVSASINGVAGGETPQPAPASGGYASAAANGIRTLTGLSGGTITIGCQIRSNSSAWGTNTSNIANMNAVIFFRR
jgi:hypothetical protein